jgi:hypothetical protein
MSQPDTASFKVVRRFKVRERWFTMLLLCVGVPILVFVQVVVGDRSVDSPWRGGVLAVGLLAIALLGFGAWRTTVSVTHSEIVVSILFATRRYRRSEVRAVVHEGGGEFQPAVLVMDHDLPFPDSQAIIPLLAGSGLADLAGLLGVPLVTEAKYRAFLRARTQGYVDLEQFVADQ